jgi:hypothetical protein
MASFWRDRAVHATAGLWDVGRAPFGEPSILADAATFAQYPLAIIQE